MSRRVARGSRAEGSQLQLSLEQIRQVKLPQSRMSSYPRFYPYWPGGNRISAAISCWQKYPEKIFAEMAKAHMRWRTERDYQNLKQDLGLGHYEGRGWRGFHHHAVLSIAAYGFLIAERIAAANTPDAQKNAVAREVFALPEDYIPRRSPARPAPRS